MLTWITFLINRMGIVQGVDLIMIMVKMEKNHVVDSTVTKTKEMVMVKIDLVVDLIKTITKMERIDLVVASIAMTKMVMVKASLAVILTRITIMMVLMVKKQKTSHVKFTFHQNQQPMKTKSLIVLSNQELILINMTKSL